MRLDQWLWAIRVFKTRSLAVDAIKNGRVEVNARACKPSHDVRADEIIVARVGEITRTLRVIGSPKSRVSAKLVALYMEDLTPAAEYEKKRGPDSIPVAFRMKGNGRPTKKERREIDGLEER